MGFDGIVERNTYKVVNDRGVAKRTTDKPSTDPFGKPEEGVWNPPADLWDRIFPKDEVYNYDYTKTYTENVYNTENIYNEVVVKPQFNKNVSNTYNVRNTEINAPNYIYNSYTINRIIVNVPFKLPKRLNQTDTQYSSKVLESLSDRFYLSFLYTPVNFAPWEYYTKYIRAEISDFYKEWGTSCEDYIEEVLSPSGDLKEGIVKNTFLKIGLPNLDTSIPIIGEDNLMSLCDFYESRSKDISNFNYYGELRGTAPEVAVIAKTPPQITEENNKINDFVYSPLGEIHRKLNRIYEVLGSSFWEDRRPKTDLEEGEINPQKFSSEDILKDNLINQFEDFKDNRPEDYDEKTDYQTVSNLLDIVKALLTTSYYRLGLNDYPVSVPSSFRHSPSQEEREELAELEAKAGNSADDYKAYINSPLYKKYMQQLPHLTRFQSWQTLILDDLLGLFPIEIGIKDSDLIKTGDQELKINLPNLSESLAEIIGLLVTDKALTEANLNANLRILGEVGSGRLTGLQTYYLLEALTDYIGAKNKKKAIKVPFSFNPKFGSTEYKVEQSISKILSETEVDLDIEELNEKSNFQIHLTSLLNSAAIIRAKFFNKLDINNLKEDFINSIKNASEVMKDDDADFVEFIQDIENGFTGYVGIQDKNNPYGRSFDQRPQVKEIKETKENQG